MAGGDRGKGVQKSAGSARDTGPAGQGEDSGLHPANSGSLSVVVSRKHGVGWPFQRSVDREQTGGKGTREGHREAW